MTQPSQTKVLNTDVEMPEKNKEVLLLATKKMRRHIASYWDRLVLEVTYENDSEFPKYFMPDKRTHKKPQASRHIFSRTTQKREE